MPPQATTVTATDNCGGALDVQEMGAGEGDLPVVCQGDVTYTWEATDCAGNENGATQTITVDRTSEVSPSCGSSPTRPHSLTSKA